MTTVSKTLTITNQQYEALETLANITMTPGKVYTIQIQNIADIKIADAEFTIINQCFSLTKSNDVVYIKTNVTGAVLTILENS